MKETYINRYGDEIIFEQISDNTITMSGYKHDWIRYGFENDYTAAYEAYMNDVSALEENVDLLINDPYLNKLRPYSFEEFKEYIHDYNADMINPLSRYNKLVTSNQNDIYMVDPSGGPYLSKGTDLERYFRDGVSRKIRNIKIDKDKTYFTI